MKLAIFGFPARHSLSPRMQSAAFRAVGLDWTYDAIEVSPEGFAAALSALREPGWRGANVTIPHKMAAFQLCDQRSAPADAIGAVNTIVVEQGRLIGHNTDAPGFADVIGDVRGLRCAVLGAGGSSRAVVHVLQSAAEVRVIRRDNWTAEAIASCDLVVGCVPPDAEPPPLDRLAPDARVIDLVYYRESALSRVARARGLQYEDGLEVLVRQGARSFELWTGRAAPLDVMREAVRNA